MVDRPVERANRGVCRHRGTRHDDFNLCEKPDEWQFQRFAGPDRPKCRKNDGAKLAKTQCANAASISTERVRVAQTDIRLSKSIQQPISRLQRFVTDLIVENENPSLTNSQLQSDLRRCEGAPQICPAPNILVGDEKPRRRQSVR